MEVGSGPLNTGERIIGDIEGIERVKRTACDGCIQ
jgi:hypothetical protein